MMSGVGWRRETEEDREQQKNIIWDRQSLMLEMLLCFNPVWPPGINGPCYNLWLTRTEITHGLLCKVALEVLTKRNYVNYISICGVCTLHSPPARLGEASGASQTVIRKLYASGSSSKYLIHFFLPRSWQRWQPHNGGTGTETEQN